MNTNESIVGISEMFETVGGQADDLELKRLEKKVLLEFLQICLNEEDVVANSETNESKRRPKRKSAISESVSPGMYY